jgi:hypothetical protein
MIPSNSRTMYLYTLLSTIRTRVISDILLRISGVTLICPNFEITACAPFSQNPPGYITKQHILTMFMMKVQLTTQYRSRGQSVSFINVNSLRTEGKQKHVLCKPKTSPAQEMRQRAQMYCRWEILFTVFTVHASLPATPPTL